MIVGMWDEVSGECGERCRGGAEECVGSPHTFSYILTHFSTPPHIPTHFSPLPHNLHTHPIHCSTPTPYLPIFPTPPPHPNTLSDSSPTISQSFHIPSYLIQVLKPPKIPHLLHHPYFPKFFLFPHSPTVLSHTFPYLLCD